MTCARVFVLVGLLAAVGSGLAGPAAAFVRESVSGGPKLRWKVPAFRYHVNKAGYRLAGEEIIPFDRVREAIEASFATWREVGCADFVFEYQGTANEPFAQFDPTNPAAAKSTLIFVEEGWPALQAEALALTTAFFDAETGEVVSADIEFNAANFKFTVGDPPERVIIDLRNTLVHEIGHVVGLDHPPPPYMLDATMQGRAPPGEISKRTLDFDDILGFCSIYGSTGGEDEDSAAADEAGGGATGSTTAALAVQRGGGPEPGGCSQAPVASVGVVWALAIVGWRARRRRKLHEQDESHGPEPS